MAHKINQLLIREFTTGMNGDEDLGQDITMKGDKFSWDSGRRAEGTSSLRKTQIS